MKEAFVSGRYQEKPQEKVTRRVAFKRAIPYLFGGLAGAIGGVAESRADPRIGNLEEMAAGHETRLDNHENVLRGHGRVLLDHDKKLNK